MIFRYVILSALKNLQYERSVSAVYYLIQGKQSIQTIQDAHLFEIDKYYRITKYLNKKRFMKEIQLLEQELYLEAMPNENYYELTSKANEWLEKNESKMELWIVNGMRYHYIDDVFFERLLLTIQVWANFVKNERTYIPVIEKFEVKHWVKQYFINSKNNVAQLMKNLYEELAEILHSIDELYVEIFVLQLTSYKKYGLAKVQIAEKTGSPKEDIELMTLTVVHQILDKVDAEPTRFPILAHLKSDVTEEKQLTFSASKTKSLLQKGYTIEQVAQQRRLKENTIYDHIVEIAIHDQTFNIQSYMTTDERHDIIKAIQQVQSYSLKDIKQAVTENISYFQIRLVLASWNKYL